MLALTRRRDEGIIINGNIEIKILDIQDGKVKLGISAPSEMTIHREEVYIEIQKNNQEAIETKKQDIEKLKRMFECI